MEIKHHFHNRDFYSPNWEIKFLFIGTFNPLGGETVKYYYGRKRNRFWKLLSEVFRTDLDPNNESFLKDIQYHKIGCIDLIKSVSFDKKYRELILGKGYKDSELFKSNIVKTYNTNEILNFIDKNNLNTVYFTNSGKSFNKEQKLELKKIEDVCKVIYLCSPSPVNRNRENCLEEYIKYILPSENL